MNSYFHISYDRFDTYSRSWLKEVEKTPILILENSQLHSVVIGINEITTEGANVTEKMMKSRAPRKDFI